VTNGLKATSQAFDTRRGVSATFGSNVEVGEAEDSLRKKEAYSTRRASKLLGEACQDDLPKYLFIYLAEPRDVILVPRR